MTYYGSHISRMSALGMQLVPNLRSELWEIMENFRLSVFGQPLLRTFRLRMKSRCHSSCRHRTTTWNRLHLFRLQKRTETVPTVI